MILTGNQIVVYQPNETVRLGGSLEYETVWLTQTQLSDIAELERKVDVLVRIKGPSVQGVFCAGQSWKVLIFTPETYDTKRVQHRNVSDAGIATFNAHYSHLAVRYTETFLDSFLIINDKELYLIGVSPKDLDSKCFTLFTKLDSCAIRNIKKTAFTAGLNAGGSDNSRKVSKGKETMHIGYRPDCGGIVFNASTLRLRRRWRYALCCQRYE